MYSNRDYFSYLSFCSSYKRDIDQLRKEAKKKIEINYKRENFKYQQL